MKRPIKLPPWYDLASYVAIAFMVITYLIGYYSGWEAPRWTMRLASWVVIISGIVEIVRKRKETDTPLLLFYVGGILFFILFIWFGQTVLGWSPY